MAPSLSARFVPLATTFNFRDLGGYRCHADRAVRQGVLYRSDSLAGLQGRDLETFLSLGIRTVVDLRDTATIDKHGRAPTVDGQMYVNVQPGNVRFTWDTYREGMDLSRFIADRYRDMADAGISHFARALEVLATPGRLPAVVHCQVGRDRTGVLAALILALLGVSDDDIADDYALSAQAEDRFNEWQRTRDPEAEPDEPHLVATPAAAMRLFLKDLRSAYGSVEGYATAAGLDADVVERLRDNLLEPTTRTH